MHQDDELCLTVQYIYLHLEEKYHFTVREWLRLRAHVAACESCAALVSKVNEANPKRAPDISSN